MDKKAVFKAILVVLGMTIFAASSTALADNFAFQLLHEKYGSGMGILGCSVADAGDVNGDGTPDFIVGNYLAWPNGTLGAGSAFVYSGSTGNLLYQVNGDSINDWFGFSVAGAGDVNGDGNNDFLVGAPKMNPNGLNDAGSAFVYSGADGTLLHRTNGTDVGGHLGYSVAGINDINGDAKADFAVGAPYVGGSSGSAFIFSGANGNILYRKDGIDYFGWAVCGIEDFNSDGTPDFVVGAPPLGPNGSVYVYSGLDGILLRQIKDTTVTTENFGGSLSSVGDVNGDGKPEIIIGARYSDPNGIDAAGTALVYSSGDSSFLYRIDGTDYEGLLGSSVNGGGDVDGDGVTDFIIGVPWASPKGVTFAGSALIYSGKSGNILGQIDGSDTADLFGYSVAIASDMNGDGKAEVIVGAPAVDSGGNNVFGAAYVYSLVSTNAPEEKDNQPTSFELSQNYPNPFNPTTTIRYSLSKREKVTLEIFNLLGERVKVLADEMQTAGEHLAVWDGKDKSGRGLPSGIYFYRLQGEDFSETKKMLLLK